MSAKSEAIPPADFAAALTEQQMSEFGEPDLFGVERRMVLATLARSGPQLMEGFKDDAEGEVLLDLVDQMTEYEKHLKALLELTEAARARLLIVGLNIDANGSEPATA